MQINMTGFSHVFSKLGKGVVEGKKLACIEAALPSGYPWEPTLNTQKNTKQTQGWRTGKFAWAAHPSLNCTNADPVHP